MRHSQGNKHCSPGPMASGTVTGGASAAGAMPASGAPLLGSTTDLLQQLHQAQALLKTADGAMQPAALQFDGPLFTYFRVTSLPEKSTRQWPSGLRLIII